MWRRSRSGSRRSGLKALAVAFLGMVNGCSNSPSRIEADSIAGSEKEQPVAAPMGEMLPSPAAWTLRGTLVVEDAEGQLDRNQSGTVVLWGEWQDEAGRQCSTHESVAVEHGMFELPMAAWIPTLRVQCASLGNKMAVGSSEPVAVPKNGPIELHAKWQQEVRLRVVARETGEDLAGVTVLAMNEPTPDAILMPFLPQAEGDGKVLIANGTSPVRFAPQFPYPDAMYWIGAHGRAWTRLRRSTTKLDEDVVSLDPGGDVRLALTGHPVPECVVVRCRRIVEPQGQWHHGECVAEFPAKGSALCQLRGLPPGDWDLTVEVGSLENVLQLGLARVRVVAGETVDANVVLDERAMEPARVHVGGTLRLSKAWGDKVTLIFRPDWPTSAWQDPLRLALGDMVATESGSYQWSAEDVRSGTYVVEVEGCDFFTRLEVQAGTTNGHVIAVPDPSRVRVRVMDEATRNPIELGATDQPCWRVTHLHPRDRFGIFVVDMDFQTIEPGDGQRPWFQCPSGSVTIQVGGGDFYRDLVDCEVAPGDQEVLVSVRRACGIDLKLKCGEEIVSPNSVALQSPGGVDAVVDSIGSRWVVAGPGTYLLSVEVPEGYELLPSQCVTVTAAEWTPVELLLRHVP